MMRPGGTPCSPIEVGDAVGDDARLAAAGPGEDQQRPFGVGDGVVLGGVEAFKDGHAFESILSAARERSTENAERLIG